MIHLSHRDRTILMKVKVSRSPIPILWLDTWFILNLTRALESTSIEKREWAQNIVDKIIILTRQKKIICPQGDQGMEIELSNNKDLVERTQRLQAQLSQGISMHFHATVEHLQVQRMMEAVVKQQKEVLFPWEDIFMDNIIKKIESKDQWLIIVHNRPKAHVVAERIKTNKSIAKAWEKLRKKARKNMQKYIETLEMEFKGKAEAIEHVMAYLVAKTIHNKKIFLSDILRADELIGKPLVWWERYSGKQNVLIAVLGFYKSDEYTKVPSVNIGCRLLAELASGNEAINPSDVMDIHNTATLFPYASYMVVDNRVRNRIEKVKLNKDYSCKIIKWQGVLPLLEKIEFGQI